MNTTSGDIMTYVPYQSCIGKKKRRDPFSVTKPELIKLLQKRGRTSGIIGKLVEVVYGFVHTPHYKK